MAVDKIIFPDGCYMAFEDNGRLSSSAAEFLKEQTRKDLSGRGIEHPCFGCSMEDDCTARAVKYHDQENRYISQPKNLKPLK
jgi:hypothetical protein